MGMCRLCLAMRSCGDLPHSPSMKNSLFHFHSKKESSVSVIHQPEHSVL